MLTYKALSPNSFSCLLANSETDGALFLFYLCLFYLFFSWWEQSVMWEHHSSINLTSQSLITNQDVKLQGDKCSQKTNFEFVCVCWVVVVCLCVSCTCMCLYMLGGQGKTGCSTLSFSTWFPWDRISHIEPGARLQPANSNGFPNASLGLQTCVWPHQTFHMSFGDSNSDLRSLLYFKWIIPPQHLSEGNRK